MKPLSSYIQEKLVIKKSNHYKYFPETKKELQDIIKKRIEVEGSEVDLNDIDVSKITDMSELFNGTNFKNFNGDISEWDVSNVKNMKSMFFMCYSFNQDISNWDVSNVKDMRFMFYKCDSFNQDISNWNISYEVDMLYMFGYCPIEEKYKPKLH